MKPKVAAPPLPRPPFHDAFDTTCVVPVRAAITPFQRLTISPSKSKVAFQPDAPEPAVLVTVTSPLKPVFHALVTANAATPAADAAGRGATPPAPVSAADRVPSTRANAVPADGSRNMKFDMPSAERGTPESV